MISKGTTVARLRICHAGPDPLAAQLRIASLLSLVDVRPPGLPPAAILCIRALRDPLPGSVSLQQGGLRPPRHWEQAVASALDHLAQRTARPALGPVPTSAEAVIFADQGELLACLASDWCEESLLAHWWWRSLLKNQEMRGVVFAAWFATPEAMPSAMQHLAAWGKALPFIRALGRGPAFNLLQNMLRRFALPQLVAIIQKALEADGPVAEFQGGQKLQETRDVEQHPAALPSDWRAPWERWVPESAEASLCFEQHCLLGMALMLQRAPAVIRSPAFAAAVLEFASAGKHAANQEEAPLVLPSHRPSREARFSLQEAQPQQQFLRQGGQDAVQASTKGAEMLPFLDAPEAPQPPLPGEADMSRRPALKLAWDSPGRAAAGITGQTAHQGPSRATEIPGLASQRWEDTPSLLEAQIDTAFGGVFYLVNLGLSLNLYGDFTTPLQAGIALDLWDFLALLGHDLLGEQMQADPLWGLLARLAHRAEEETPGSGFTPPESWRLPGEWLAPFRNAAPWEWAAERGRLRVKHPEGFLLLDVPLTSDDAARQALAEIQGYQDSAPFTFQPGEALAASASLSPLERWLGWLAPYVRSRLGCALDTANSADLVQRLCCHHARVLVTATRLDVFFALADLPIQVRLAGLDRDPGWVPAAGKVIAFHFD